MAHRTARLNVFGRQLLVTRVEIDGWPIAKAGPDLNDGGLVSGTFSCG